MSLLLSIYSFLSDVFFFSPIEVTSKKPVTRRRQIVEVPKMVCLLGAALEVCVHIGFRKCEIHGSYRSQENFSRNCIGSRTASSRTCTKRNFRR